MKNHSTLTLAALLLLSGFMLSACAGDDNPDEADKAEVAAEAPPKTHDEALKRLAALPICPQVAIVRGLDDMRDYGGEKPDASELVAGAKLMGVQGQCEYTDTGIDVHFDLNMVAARGPRLGGKHTSFPFFVAVVEPSGTILNKERMTAEFNFSGDERTANTAETLHVFIPLPIAKRGLGPDYRVLMGFQLSAAQP